MSRYGSNLSVLDCPYVEAKDSISTRRDSEHTRDLLSRFVPQEIDFVLQQAIKDHPELINTLLSYRDEKTYDAVIALGKNWYYSNNGVPIALSVESKVTALAAGILYLQGKVKRIIFATGTTTSNPNLSEAREMAKFLRKCLPSIPEEALLLEERSFDTAGNAEETRKIIEEIGIDTIALLTVGYHAERAARLFKSYSVSISAVLNSEDLLSETLAGTEAADTIQEYFRSKNVIHERLKEAALSLLVRTIDPNGTNFIRKATRLLRRH